MIRPALRHVSEVMVVRSLTPTTCSRVAPRVIIPLQDGKIILGGCEWVGVDPKFWRRVHVAGPCRRQARYGVVHGCDAVREMRLQGSTSSHLQTATMPTTPSFSHLQIM